MQKNKKAINLTTLTMGAMLTALSIVIGIFCKNFMNFGNGLFRITFENFPIILSGILFGPGVGAIVGISSDVLSYVLSTQSFAISPLVTLGAATVGLVSGFAARCLKRKKLSLRLIISTFSAHLVGSVIIKSIGLYAYYSSAVLIRIPLYLIISTLETILIYFLFRNSAFRKIAEKKGNHNDL